MRAVSHPARWRVLEELWAGRVLTATEAAQLVGITPSAMSYHLQQLARLDLIERDESADGREHPWKASDVRVHMTAQPDPPLGRTMMQNLSRSINRLVLSPPPAEGDTRPWPASFTHRRLKLTRQQAGALYARINALLKEYEELGDVESADACEHDVFWVSGVAAAD